MISQAYVCWSAARSHTQELGNNLFQDYGVMSESVHRIANVMDDCTSYSTHKYVDDAAKAAIQAFMDKPDGSGVFGFWTFKDTSMLFALCGDDARPNDCYCIVETVEIDGEKKRQFRDMREWPTTTRVKVL